MSMTESDLRGVVEDQFGALDGKLCACFLHKSAATPLETSRAILQVPEGANSACRQISW
jgi:hypothetical protein